MNEQENNIIEFSGEYQCQYFSHLRKNMQSDVAGVIMFGMQQLDELYLFRKWTSKRSL